MSSSLRVLFFANDGLGAGHLTRTLAIARALRRKVDRVEAMLATTSEAHDLLAAEPTAAVRWPPPMTARGSNWSDVTRRDVASRVVRAAIEGFRPELLVTDTFPAGPHGELSGLVRMVPRRALVRRSVRADRSGEPVVDSAVSDYDIAIVPDDPESLPMSLRIPIIRVPPITLFEADEALDRPTARARLGLPAEGRLILVCSGGGGDVEAGAEAERIAHGIARVSGALPVLAIGPLAHGRPCPEGVRRIEVTPLQPLMAAFDGAFAPAGYNSAHELAKAAVPLALFSRPRPFDDQAGRAARFEAAGLALALSKLDDTDIAAALRWMEQAPRSAMTPGGAGRAADALLQLVAREPT